MCQAVRFVVSPSLWAQHLHLAVPLKVHHRAFRLIYRKLMKVGRAEAAFLSVEIRLAEQQQDFSGVREVLHRSKLLELDDPLVRLEILEKYLNQRKLLERQKATDMAEGLKAEIATIEGTLKSYEADIAKLQGKLREARARQNAIAARFESWCSRRSAVRASCRRAGGRP